MSEYDASLCDWFNLKNRLTAENLKSKNWVSDTYYLVASHYFLLCKVQTLVLLILDLAHIHQT